MNCSAQLQKLSQQLSHQSDAQGIKQNGTADMKELRKFSLRETASFLKVNYNTFRHYIKTMSDRIPTGYQGEHKKRLLSLEKIDEIRQILCEEGKMKTQICPRRQADEPCIVISCLSQKEEVSLSAHVATNLALRGYRVLCCDLDARAILTRIFGSMPDRKPSVPSVYEMIRSKEPLAARGVIQKTYIPKIDLIPASVNLLEFEVALSFWGAIATDSPHTRVAKALEPVLPDYDVVIVNTPYQLSYGMIAGLLASQGVLIPVNLSKRAFESLKNTLKVVDKLMGLAETDTPDRGFDFLKVLITRSEVMNYADVQAASFLRNTLGKSVMQAEFCKSDLLIDLSASNQTVFDIDPQSVTRKSYDEVTEPIYRITAELEENISKARGRIA